MKNERATLLILVLLSFVFCACGGKPRPKPDTTNDPDAGNKEREPVRDDYIGADKKVDPTVLVFNDKLIGERFTKLRACFANGASTDGWAHYPLRKIGNFVQEDWCRGPGSSRGCSGGSFRDRPGDTWFTLHTLHYDSQWPGVFGLGAIAGNLPQNGDWGVRFSYYKDGKTIIGEGLHVTFMKFDGRESSAKILLGDSYSYKVEETDCTISGLDKDVELEVMLSSPEALKRVALARLNALEEKVDLTISSGKVRKCVYGPYEGGGIPPECTLTPLTDAENATQLGIAKTYIGDQRNAISANAELFHRLLTELIDFDKCW